MDTLLKQWPEAPYHTVGDYVKILLVHHGIHPLGTIPFYSDQQRDSIKDDLREAYIRQPTWKGNEINIIWGGFRGETIEQLGDEIERYMTEHSMNEFGYPLCCDTQFKKELHEGINSKKRYYDQLLEVYEQAGIEALEPYATFVHIPHDIDCAASLNQEEGFIKRNYPLIHEAALESLIHSLEWYKTAGLCYLDGLNIRTEELCDVYNPAEDMNA